MSNAVLDDLLEHKPRLGDRLVEEGLRQLSLPGQYIRGGWAGHPTKPATGVEVLQHHGLAGTHDPLGVVKGLGSVVEAATDPLTYLGGIGEGTKLLGSVGKAAKAEANPLLSAMHRATTGRSGYLRFPLPGVPPEMAKAMDAVGPQYPGGLDKLRAIGSQMGEAELGLHEGSRIERLINSLGPESAELVASEIPEGSKYLGSGFEGIAIEGPQGQVIRIGDSGNIRRASGVQELLHPYRVAEHGGIQVEHMPKITPFPSREFGGNQARQLSDRIFEQGLSPIDVDSSRYFNAGLTREGKAVIHDPGAVSGGRHVATKQYPTYRADPESIKMSLGAGGPALVRQSLDQGIAAGTTGQGVDLPGLEELLKAHPQMLDPEASKVMGARPTLPPFSGNIDSLFDDISQTFKR